MKKKIILLIALSLNTLFIGCDLYKSENNNLKNFSSTKKKIVTENSLNPIVNNQFNFDIELADTLTLGYNKGKILGYKEPKEGDDCLLSVIIENKYEDGIVKRDTFSNGTLNPNFEVYVFEKGVKTIKGAVLEEILSIVEINGESAVQIDKTYKYFSLNSYVKDTLSAQSLPTLSNIKKTK